MCTDRSPAAMARRSCGRGAHGRGRLRKRSSLVRVAPILAIATVATTVACVATPPPRTQLAAAQAELEHAEVDGAVDMPDARLHLQLASEDLEQARRIAVDDPAHAASLAKVAYAEARLAGSLARRGDARARARAVEAELRKTTEP